jgi:hypothetical protein
MGTAGPRGESCAGAGYYGVRYGKAEHFTENTEKGGGHEDVLLTAGVE